MSKIEVWETEDAMLVVWGTHDPHRAYGAALDWYTENSEVPHGLASMILDVTVTGFGENWANPGVRDLEEAAWPSKMWSRTPVEGWTPYLVVCW